MHKLMKFLTPLVLFSAFLLASSSATAAPTIPPTAECVSLTAKMLKKLPNYPSDAQEKKAIQQLVDSGCIPKSIFDRIDPAPAEECAPYLASAVEYLAPINAQAATSPRVKAAIKRVVKIDKRYDKKMRLEDRRLDKAIKKGDQKAIKKISNRMAALRNKEANLKRKALLSDPKIFNNYLANFYLVFLDLATNGCEDSAYSDDLYNDTKTLWRLLFAQYV
jgi:hypothetical protein